MRFPVRSLGAVLVGMLATSASAQSPSPQYPMPPAPNPGFSTPPTPERAPTPAAAPRAPAPQTDTGEIEQTTRARGAAIVNNGGTVIYQSPGVSAPAAVAAYPARAAAPARLAIPPSVIALGVRRLGGGLYYAVTGQCPTARPVAVVPVTTEDGFSTPPSAAPQRAAAPQPQEVVVRVVHEQAYAPAPAASPSPQSAPAPRHWSLFHR